MLKLLYLVLCITADRHKIQSVGEWLDSLGLGQYENTLVANGFDDTDFLVSKRLELAFLLAPLYACMDFTAKFIYVHVRTYF